MAREELDPHPPAPYLAQGIILDSSWTPAPPASWSWDRDILVCQCLALGGLRTKRKTKTSSGADTKGSDRRGLRQDREAHTQ